MGETQLGARKDKTWYAMCTEPSITKTPVGPVQVPVPYQVICDLSTAVGLSPNVKFNGDPVFLLDQSKIPKCKGDERGTGGGSRSGTTSDFTIAISGSGTIKINGKSPVRAGDLCTLNKGNCKGKFIKAAPPTIEPKMSKNVRVKIVSSQKAACPEGSIELTAVASPKGGVFDWSCEGPCKLVDQNGKPQLGGDKIYLQVDKDKDTDSTLKSVTVFVEYIVNGESQDDLKSFQIHPELPLWGIWGLWIGKVSNFTSGDEFGVVDKNHVVHKDPSNLFDFKDQPYALVVIPGMNMEYDETISMQETCNYTFKVHNSALIQNYTHGLPRDVVQSTGSEALGAIDRNAKATADAVMKGIRQKGEVYVVAHSQGSEIFAKALQLLKYSLKAVDLRKIHYQGFGSETNIHNTHGLGSVRNVRTQGDPIPTVGTMAKRAKAALLGAPLISMTEIEIANEIWEEVDSPIPLPHYFECNVFGRHYLYRPTTHRHGFLDNYWIHVKIPRMGYGKPDYEPAVYKTYSEEAQDAIKKWSEEAFPKKSGGGLRVLGK